MLARGKTWFKQYMGWDPLSQLKKACKTHDSAALNAWLEHPPSDAHDLALCALGDAMNHPHHLKTLLDYLASKQQSTAYLQALAPLYDQMPSSTRGHTHLARAYWQAIEHQVDSIDSDLSLLGQAMRNYQSNHTDDLSFRVFSALLLRICHRDRPRDVACVLTHMQPMLKDNKQCLALLRQALLTSQYPSVHTVIIQVLPSSKTTIRQALKQHPTSLPLIEAYSQQLLEQNTPKTTDRALRCIATILKGDAQSESGLSLLKKTLWQACEQHWYQQTQTAIGLLKQYIATDWHTPILHQALAHTLSILQDDKEPERPVHTIVVLILKHMDRTTPTPQGIQAFQDHINTLATTDTQLCVRQILQPAAEKKPLPPKPTDHQYLQHLLSDKGPIHWLCSMQQGVKAQGVMSEHWIQACQLLVDRASVYPTLQVVLSNLAQALKAAEDDCPTLLMLIDAIDHAPIASMLKTLIAHHSNQQTREHQRFLTMVTQHTPPIATCITSRLQTKLGMDTLKQACQLKHRIDALHNCLIVQVKKLAPNDDPSLDATLDMLKTGATTQNMPSIVESIYTKVAQQTPWVLGNIQALLDKHQSHYLYTAIEAIAHTVDRVVTPKAQRTLQQHLATAITQSARLRNLDCMRSALRLLPQCCDDAQTSGRLLEAAQQHLLHSVKEAHCDYAAHPILVALQEAGAPRSHALPQKPPEALHYLFDHEPLCCFWHLHSELQRMLQAYTACCFDTLQSMPSGHSLKEALQTHQSQMPSLWPQMVQTMLEQANTVQQLQLIDPLLATLSPAQQTIQTQRALARLDNQQTVYQILDIRQLTLRLQRQPNADDEQALCQYGPKHTPLILDHLPHLAQTESGCQLLHQLLILYSKPLIAPKRLAWLIELLSQPDHAFKDQALAALYPNTVLTEHMDYFDALVHNIIHSPLPHTIIDQWLAIIKQIGPQWPPAYAVALVQIEQQCRADSTKQIVMMCMKYLDKATQSYFEVALPYQPLPSDQSTTPLTERIQHLARMLPKLANKPSECQCIWDIIAPYQDSHALLFFECITNTLQRSSHEHPTLKTAQTRLHQALIERFAYYESPNDLPPIKETMPEVYLCLVESVQIQAAHTQTLDAGHPWVKDLSEQTLEELLIRWLKNPHFGAPETVCFHTLVNVVRPQVAFNLAHHRIGSNAATITLLRHLDDTQAVDPCMYYQALLALFKQDHLSQSHTISTLRQTIIMFAQDHPIVLVKVLCAQHEHLVYHPLYATLYRIAVEQWYGALCNNATNPYHAIMVSTLAISPPYTTTCLNALRKVAPALYYDILTAIVHRLASQISSLYDSVRATIQDLVGLAVEQKTTIVTILDCLPQSAQENYLIAALNHPTQLNQKVLAIWQPKDHSTQSCNAYYVALQQTLHQHCHERCHGPFIQHCLADFKTFQGKHPQGYLKILIRYAGLDLPELQRTLDQAFEQFAKDHNAQMGMHFPATEAARTALVRDDTKRKNLFDRLMALFLQYLTPQLMPTPASIKHFCQHCAHLAEEVCVLKLYECVQAGQIEQAKLFAAQLNVEQAFGCLVATLTCPTSDKTELIKSCFVPNYYDSPMYLQVLQQVLLSANHSPTHITWLLEQLATFSRPYHNTSNPTQYDLWALQQWLNAQPIPYLRAQLVAHFPDARLESEKDKSQAVTTLMGHQSGKTVWMAWQAMRPQCYQHVLCQAWQFQRQELHQRLVALDEKQAQSIPPMFLKLDTQNEDINALFLTFANISHLTQAQRLMWAYNQKQVLDAPLITIPRDVIQALMLSDEPMDVMLYKQVCRTYGLLDQLSSLVSFDQTRFTLAHIQRQQPHASMDNCLRRIVEDITDFMQQLQDNQPNVIAQLTFQSLSVPGKTMHFLAFMGQGFVEQIKVAYAWLQLKPQQWRRMAQEASLILPKAIEHQRPPTLTATNTQEALEHIDTWLCGQVTLIQTIQAWLDEQNGLDTGPWLAPPELDEDALKSFETFWQQYGLDCIETLANALLYNSGDRSSIDDAAADHPLPLPIELIISNTHPIHIPPLIQGLGETMSMIEQRLMQQIKQGRTLPAWFIQLYQRRAQLIPQGMNLFYKMMLTLVQTDPIDQSPKWLEYCKTQTPTLYLDLFGLILRQSYERKAAIEPLAHHLSWHDKITLVSDALCQGNGEDNYVTHLVEALDEDPVVAIRMHNSWLYFHALAHSLLKQDIHGDLINYFLTELGICQSEIPDRHLPYLVVLAQHVCTTQRYHQTTAIKQAIDELIGTDKAVFDEAYQRFKTPCDHDPKSYVMREEVLAQCIALSQAPIQ